MMASTYKFSTTLAEEPKPNAMTDTTYSFEDVYEKCNTMLTILSGSVTNMQRLYTLGTDAALHYIQGMNFLTPELEAQTIASQTWTVKIRLQVSSLPSIATIGCGMRLFLWDGSTDTLKSYIGTTQFSTALTATNQLKTLTVTAGASIANGDKIGADVFLWLDDDPTDSGVVTLNIRYDGLSGSQIESPATIVEAAGIPYYYQSWTP